MNNLITDGAEKAVTMETESADESIDACSIKGSNPSPSDQTQEQKQ